MASVTFPIAFGGDGNTYTDGRDPDTGLSNDGHRARYVPTLANAVAMAQWCKLKADETHADRLQAASDSAKAGSAKTAAESAASAAKTAADSATASAQIAAAYYATMPLALENTVSGDYFQVAENGYIQLYRNDGGSAKPILKMASQETLDAFNARPDSLLTSLLF